MTYPSSCQHRFHQQQRPALHPPPAVVCVVGFVPSVELRSRDLANWNLPLSSLLICEMFIVQT